ncbi:MAG: hypothetical protein Roseis2KO_32500 [Roseivirga sp.]
MDIRQMIHQVRFLITIALLVSFGLMSFSFANYDRFEEPTQNEQVWGCATVSPYPVSNTEEFTGHPGFKLFKDWGCNTCHAIDRKVVGPALANIRDRRSDDWLRKFIKNSSAVIESNDSYAVDLYNQYNQLQMPNHDLSDEEIASILEYITAASEANQ